MTIKNNVKIAYIINNITKPKMRSRQNYFFFSGVKYEE